MACFPNIGISKEVFNLLRCSRCQGYLSRFPVYICEEIGTICGRCPLVQDENPVHNEAFENVAQFLEFPCINNVYGCHDELLPVCVSEHEESCHFKQYYCPLLPSGCCAWQGLYTELYEHFSENHNYFILPNYKFELDITLERNENYLLFFDNETFLLHKRPVDQFDAYLCSVQYLGPKKLASVYSFQLQLMTGTLEKKEYTYPLQEVQTYTNPNVNPTNEVKIETAIAKYYLGNPAHIICKVIMTKAGQKSNSEATECAETVSGSQIICQNNILSLVECPICLESMMPPIFMCEVGHSVCEECKNKICQCPTCRSPIKNTRNFLVEKLTDQLIYSCRYQGDNCSFMSNSRSVKKHEENCKFGPYKCPLHNYLEACSWIGKHSDIFKHIGESHSDNVMVGDIVKMPYQAGENRSDCFIFKKFGEVFRLFFKFQDGEFFWSVQFIGQTQDSGKFMFIMEVIDENNLGQKIFFKKPCAAQVTLEESFIKETPHIKLPLAIVEDLIKNFFSFKLKIVLQS